MEAFWELTTSRQIGQVPGPISWTSVHLWAGAHQLDPATASTLQRGIREMDVVYLDWTLKAIKDG